MFKVLYITNGKIDKYETNNSVIDYKTLKKILKYLKSLSEQEIENIKTKQEAEKFNF